MRQLIMAMCLFPSAAAADVLVVQTRGGGIDITTNIPGPVCEYLVKVLLGEPLTPEAEARRKRLEEEAARYGAQTGWTYLTPYTIQYARCIDTERHRVR